MELTNMAVIKPLLSKNGIVLTKARGQNFIINPSVCPRMADECGAGENDGVLEIGPGIGVLTAELAKRAGKVVSIELDSGLVPILSETLAEFDNVSNEISAMLTLPKKLEKVWYTRPYYGTLAHNSKAVYQKYLGWYDANPVNLNPLPPSDTARKLVEYLGSTELVLCKAKKDYEKGEYQWVAQITKELVYADPSNQKARNLCADALEQLGYQAESGAWRNAYLMGAAELRKGNLSKLARSANGLTATMGEMTIAMLLDYIAIMTDANAAQNDDLTLNLTVTDVNEQFYVTRTNGILLSYPGENHPDAQASVTCKRLQLFALMTGQQAGQVQISGDATVLKRLLAYASTQ